MPRLTSTLRSLYPLARFFLLLALALAFAPKDVLASTPAAQMIGRIDFAGLDSFITAQMEKQSFPGVALAITESDQIIYGKGYGIAGPGRPMTADTPMYIGSASKSFTGTALMQLVEQGKVDLNQPVRSYLPWFHVADESASRQLTLFDLAHHASGLADSGYDILPADGASIEEGVRLLRFARLTAPIGSESQYFNANYAVLSLVIQTVSGQPYDQYVQEHIFQPLKMEHAYTDPLAAKQNGLAQGYTRFFPFPVPIEQPFRVYDQATGYLMAGADDMAHYMIAMNNDGEYQGARVLSPDSIRISRTPSGARGFQYGIGWFVDTFNGYTRIAHGGANETFKTQMVLYPQLKRGVVVLVNQGHLIDAYISTPQLFDGVELFVTGGKAPDSAAGPSVTSIGWGIFLAFLALCAFQVSNLLKLRRWREKARTMSAGKRAFDIALNFIIPTVITGVILWQVSAFLGNRFNLWQTVRGMSVRLPDLLALSAAGTLPDLLQGLVKLAWLGLRKI